MCPPLGGQTIGNIIKISDKIKFIEKYAGKDVMENIILTNLQSFAQVNLETLKETINFLEDYIQDEKIVIIQNRKVTVLQGKEIIIYILTKSFQGFKLAKIERLEEIIKFLEEYIEKNEVIRKIVKDWWHFASSDPKKLKIFLESFDENVRKQIIAEMIIRGIRIVTRNYLQEKKDVDNQGGQIIVNYVQKYYEQKGIDLPTGWLEKIDYYTYYLTEASAGEFLNFLERRIGPENTVKGLIQSPSVLQNIKTFKTFKARVDFYEEYIGEEAVNKILSKSLAGFVIGNIIKISDKIKFIEKYAGKDVMENIILTNLQSFPYINLETLKETINFLEDYIQDEKIVIIQNGKMTVLQGKEIIIYILKKSFQGFKLAKIENLEETIKIFEEYIEKVVVIKRMVKAWWHFASADPKKLKALLDYFNEYDIEKKIITEIITKSVAGMAIVNLEELKDLIDFLEPYIGKEGIIARLRSGFISFTTIKRKRLEQLEKEWGKDLMKERLDKYALGNPIFR